jgi:hypothetical protein
MCAESGGAKRENHGERGTWEERRALHLAFLSRPKRLDSTRICDPVKADLRASTMDADAGETYAQPSFEERSDDVGFSLFRASRRSA